MIDPQIFDQLKEKLDEESKVHKSLSEIVDQLETQIAYAQGLLSRIHGTPRAECMSTSVNSHHQTDHLIGPALLEQIEQPVRKEIDQVGELSKFASNYPYYK